MTASKVNATETASSGGGATADEVTLAGKGFNDQVEKSYSSQNSAANFAAVDAMEPTDGLGFSGNRVPAPRRPDPEGGRPVKTLKLAVPLAAVLLAGCAALQNLDVSSMTGGRVSNDQFHSATKAATALRSGFADISESEEYYIGRAVAAQIMSRYRPLDNPELNSYAQHVAQAVAMASDRPSIYRGYHVQVLKSPEVNAFAAPGGFIFVTTGLLKLVHNEDELACVLAHEVAHVPKKHGLKTIKTSRLTCRRSRCSAPSAAKTYSPGQVAQGSPTRSRAPSTTWSTNLVVNGYSRDKRVRGRQVRGPVRARRQLHDPNALKAFLTRTGRGGLAAGSGRHVQDPSEGLQARRRAGKSLTATADYQASPTRDRRFKASLRP